MIFPQMLAFAFVSGFAAIVAGHWIERKRYRDAALAIWLSASLTYMGGLYWWGHFYG